MRFEITAPARGFDGEVAGVRFHKGRATADSEQHAAALGYLRRKGYTVVPTEEPEPAAETRSPFDPGEHSVDDVLAYLDDAEPAEGARVLAAERAGKARKTILARAAEPGPDDQGETA